MIWKLICRSVTLTCVGLFAVVISETLAPAQSLEDLLRRSTSTELANLARQQGDAARGAIVFFQPHMACSKCHSVGDGPTSILGPDLTTIFKDGGDESIVESVLEPSKVSRKGYESLAVTTTDGRAWNGLLVERTADKLTFRDVARAGELTILTAGDIGQVKPSATSIMPAGQVNQLAS